ncbi:hypothetical protein L195_g052940, partial [Trifolium pratense]
MRNMSAVLRSQACEHMREVKVVMFCEKARNPLVGNGNTLRRWSHVTLSEKVEIWQRRLSRYSLEILREVRLGNLRKREGRYGP